VCVRVITHKDEGLSLFGHTYEYERERDRERASVCERVITHKYE